jgi:hypothetical protein
MAREHPTIREVAEFGLESIPRERTVTVPVRELARLFGVLGELNAFFHQPMHYPDVNAVAAFLGSRGDGGAYELISEAYYDVLPRLLPPDVMRRIEDGEFDHPAPPRHRAPDDT